MVCIDSDSFCHRLSCESSMWPDNTSQNHQVVKTIKNNQTTRWRIQNSQRRLIILLIYYFFGFFHRAFWSFSCVCWRWKLIYRSLFPTWSAARARAPRTLFIIIKFIFSANEALRFVQFWLCFWWFRPHFWWFWPLIFDGFDHLFWWMPSRGSLACLCEPLSNPERICDKIKLTFRHIFLPQRGF